MSINLARMPSSVASSIAPNSASSSTSNSGLNLITKFDCKSSRVKALAFHPTLPWLLIAQHNGACQIYDYRMGTVVEKYEEHEGPVRACAFHPTQPLFCTGGDDNTVKVFNYRQRKLLFTLNGHLDYVRSVAFHHEAPWILTASDDQTVRIWNWQSRQCVAVLSGHNHYVMSAAFHPTQDLIVSGSLDQTIRVWDVSAIRAKNAPSLSGSDAFGSGGMKISSGSSLASSSKSNSGQIELFSGSGLDASVKFIVEGHDRGVNWVQFHPTKPLILSGSDDRSVKIFKFNDVRAWEVETFRGHMNNVSCVLWHPRADMFLSDSEDKTLRVWDCGAAVGSSNVGGSTGRPRSANLLTVKREGDRFWSLAVHPELNLFAAGHDHGFIVFKLERERPAFTVADGEVLYFVKDRLIRSFGLDGGEGQGDEFVAPLEMPLKLPGTVSFSPAERALIISSNNSSISSSFTVLSLKDKGNPIVGSGSFANFIARNRFVVLEKDTHGICEINIKSLQDPLVTVRSIPLPSESVNRILPGPIGSFLAVSPSQVFLIEAQSGRIIASVELNGVKYAVWSKDFNSLALLSKKSIYLVDKGTLKVTASHTDTSGVKSGAWDSCPDGKKKTEIKSMFLLLCLGDIFYYTNSFHLKYLLPHGDAGIICTISAPIYLVRVEGEIVHAVDRQCNVLVVSIDPAECHFKLALKFGDYSKIIALIEGSNLVGQSIISYLKSNGYAEIALQFVRDSNSRFELAVECANLSVAIEAAELIDSKSCWERLGESAMLLGNIEIAREAWRRAGNPIKLAFIDMITGCQSESKSASDPSSSSSSLQRALWSFDDVDGLSIEFLQRGFPVLAYLTCKVNGREEDAETLFDQCPNKENVDFGSVLIEGQSFDSTIVPCEESSWPLLFESSKTSNQQKEIKSVASAAVASVGDEGGWGDLTLASDLEIDNDLDIPVDSDAIGFDDLDLDIPLDEEDLAMLRESSEGAEVALADLSLPNSLLIDEFNTLNSVEEALKGIAEVAGVLQFTPVMKLTVESILAARNIWIPMAGGLVTRLPLITADNDDDDYSALLRLGAIERLRQAREVFYERGLTLTTLGKFPEAIDSFRSFLQVTSLIILDDQEVNDEAEPSLLALKKSARSYVIGLTLEQRRKGLIESNSDPAAILDLACLFTKCALKPEHLILALRAALALAYKNGAYRTAASLARRLLSLPGLNETVQLQARKVLSVAEKSKYSEALSLSVYPRIEGNNDWKGELVVDLMNGQVKLDGEVDGRCGACLAAGEGEQVCGVCGVGRMN